MTRQQSGWELPATCITSLNRDKLPNLFTVDLLLQLTTIINKYQHINWTPFPGCFDDDYMSNIIFKILFWFTAASKTRSKGDTVRTSQTWVKAIDCVGKLLKQWQTYRSSVGQFRLHTSLAATKKWWRPRLLETFQVSTTLWRFLGHTG